MSETLSESRVARRLRFRDLQVFFAIVECGSMAKAAARLKMTQPAVSEIVAALESAFAAQLFDRSPRGVEATIYGRALLKRGLAAFDELKQGIRDIEFLADPTTGEVRLGCTDAISATILPAVQNFCIEFPRIALRVDTLAIPTGDLPELQARKVDFVLTRLSSPNQFGDELNMEILVDDPPVVVAGANSPWARRRKIDLSELVDEPWTCTPRDTLTTMLIEEMFRASNLPVPRTRVTTYSVLLRTHLLARGNFLAALPRSMLRLNTEGIGLRELPVELPRRSFPIIIVTLKNRVLSAAAELFLERLRAFVRSNFPGERAGRGMSESVGSRRQ
ncbi:MAG TPA: LysR family transcriptional regulator [Burkholderiales bacterium]|nr:LysR family transcriptional regulator [Burkholderiales bacterium]